MSELVTFAARQGLVEGGRSTNLLLAAANSPAGLDWMDCQSRTVGRMQLGHRMKLAVALRVAQMQQSEYGLATHGEEAARENIPEADRQAFRRGISDDPKEQTVLALVSKVVRDHGRHAALAIESAKALGVTKSEIVEIIALIAMHTFANHLAGAANVAIDHPRAENLAELGANLTASA